MAIPSPKSFQNRDRRGGQPAFAQSHCFLKHCQYLILYRGKAAYLPVCHEWLQKGGTQLIVR